jgi:hypothetical protein
MKIGNHIDCGMKLIFILLLFLSCTPTAFGQQNPKLKKQILGFWMPKDAPEGIEILKDSVYYVTNFKSYKYTLTKDDTLIIDFGGYLSKSKVLLNKDTLIWKGESTNYFIRSK